MIPNKNIGINIIKLSVAINSGLTQPKMQNYLIWQ